MKTVIHTLRDIYKARNALPHAIVLEGEKSAVFPELVRFIESDFGFTTARNPDFFCETFDTFGIEEARHIKAAAARKAFAGDQKIFAVCANTITHEAQNALLKTLEEPAYGTHFFVVLPDARVLLPTFLSRVVVISREGPGERDYGEEDFAIQFLHAVPARRLELVSSYVEESDKSRVLAFLGALEDMLYRKGFTREMPHVFSELRKARAFLLGRTPSIKLILEHIALVVPVLKEGSVTTIVD